MNNKNVNDENKKIEDLKDNNNEEKCNTSKWDWRDDLIDEMQHYYSFGALRLDPKQTGLSIDIYLCQNQDYLIETGKYKVFFYATDEHQYGSEGYGIIENGDVYIKNFENCVVPNCVIDDIIRFIYNNNFYLQLLVFDAGEFRYIKFIKDHNYITDGKMLYAQLNSAKEILRDVGRKLEEMHKWWDRDHRLKTGIDAEFCHNLIKWKHRQYYKELRFGQFMYLFDSWYRDIYDRDYFSLPDTSMPRIIDIFVLYSIMTNPEYRNSIIGKPNKDLIEKIINIIPSLTLRRAYKEDIKISKYPNWRYNDIISMILNLIFDYDKRLDYLKLVLEELQNKGINETNSLYKDLNNLIDMHVKTRNLYDDSKFISYVPIKIIFKGGDLIKFKHKSKVVYGMVSQYDRNGAFFDITDNSYHCFILDPANIDINNDDDIYACHDHPSVFLVEDADESELNENQKLYLQFLRKKFNYNNN